MNPKQIPIPASVRNVVLRRAAGHCEQCNTECRTLELHHLTYDGRRYPDPIFGDETPDDLMALCRQCHLRKHLLPSGAFEADIDEVRAVWDAFAETN